jgi:hypothetical protein
VYRHGYDRIEKGCSGFERAECNIERSSNPGFEIMKRKEEIRKQWKIY